jgi:hypothetical protein
VNLYRGARFGFYDFPFLPLSLPSDDLMDYMPILRPPARLRDKTVVTPTPVGRASKQVQRTNKDKWCLDFKLKLTYPLGVISLARLGNSNNDLLLSNVCSEIEESCLLVCHFYLPKEKSNIYIGKLGPPCCLRLSWRLTPPRHLGASSAEPLRTGEYNRHV